MIERLTNQASEENFSPDVELRSDARISVSERGAYTVQLQLGHYKLHADCVDYSPFGLGLRLPAEAELPLLSIGEPVDLECSFLGSKFNARGVIANTRMENTESGRFIRIGVALSRSAEVVRPSHVKRKSARIQISPSVSPLVFVSDELRFGETIFAKMTDISHGGMRLLVDRSPLPFMEKQRYWFEIALPLFGLGRAYCRIAHVLRDAESQKYSVGCEFIDGGIEQNLSALQDWLYFAHNWLTRSDIIAAGFALKHLDDLDERCRVTLSGEITSASWVAEEVAPPGRLSQAEDTQNINFGIVSGEETITIRAEYSLEQKLLVFCSVEPQVFTLSNTAPFWKALLLFTLYNGLPQIRFDKSLVNVELIRGSLLAKDVVLQRGFAAEQLMTGAILKLSLWRRVMHGLKNRDDLNIQPSDSFIRRFSLLS